ncbi:uncharacterized protein LOC134527170 [Bacillus rossius redtenbacheri]|uniref:uncharacterized protein LOC134527170 n=1 Tax=Bacillus rossius redtenbacheri TaxID=93214 RepID=UPI002FDEF4F6
MRLKQQVRFHTSSNMVEKKVTKYLTVYNKAYSDKFPCILTSKKGDHFAFCSLCRSDFAVSHGGRWDVVKHIQTKKHQDNVRCVDANKKLSFCGSASRQEESVTNAECLFTCFVLEHNLPVSCSDHAGLLFRKMFPDSAIAQQFGCARTKTSAIISEMVKTEEEKLVQTLKNGAFSVATYGSNDSDSKLYPVVVSYYSSEEGKVESSVLCVPVLSGDSTGVNIAALVIQSLRSRNIKLQNCISFSTDNAPVMIGLKNGAATHLKKEMPNLFVAGCACHLINLAAEKAAATLPCKVDEILVDIYFYLEKSAKRKDKLKEFQVLHDTDVKKNVKTCLHSLALAREMFVKNAATVVEVKSSRPHEKSGQLDSYRIPKMSKAASSDSQTSVKCSSLKRSSESPVPDSKLTKFHPAQKSGNSSCNLSREERLLMFLTRQLNK